MAVKLPNSTEEVVYWTTRKIGKGQIKAWAYRGDCPECGKAKMGKPLGDKGNVKIRATYYECPKCRHKKAYYWTVQTRAGDEAETKFLKCEKCSHTWRDYD